MKASENIMPKAKKNTENIKILLPKVDVIFKLLFGDKRNIEILRDFLKAVLNLSEDEYETITLEDTHLKRETVDDKLGIVDVRLTTKSGKIVHIEMQILEQDDMPERITYYNAKMLVTQLKSGDDYRFQKTISIAIADFEIVKDSPKYHHRFQLNDIEAGVKFTDVMEINTLELTKIPEQSDSTTKYDWVQFLRAEKEEEFDMLAEKSPVIKKAVVELKRLSKDEKAQRLYEAREKALRDENSRTKTAVNKTVIEAEKKFEKKAYDDKIQSVRNFIKMGLSDSQIAEGMGMSIEAIENMRKN
jgi:predicted transposase/invertase (TIGR01784 family)